MGLEDLSEIERKTYEIIKEAGEIQPKNLPNPRMMACALSITEKART
jgi:hypothetical protein